MNKKLIQMLAVKTLLIIFLAIGLLGCGQENGPNKSSGLEGGSSASIKYNGSGSSFGSSQDSNMLKGFNPKGVAQECARPPQNLVCDMMYTQAEQFAAKCSQSGGQVLNCGCHSYLCSKKIVFP